MKTKLFVIAFATAAIGSLGLRAANEDTTAPEPADQPPPRDRAAFIERFDTDGDGKLSAEERVAARAEMGKRRGQAGPNAGRGRMGPGGAGRQMMARFDKDGDGKLSEEERAEARKFREEMTAKYDADGDGRLSREEMRAARQAMGTPAGNPRGGQQALREEKHGGSKKGRNKNREKMIERFDKDGDGQLSPEELDEARAEMARRRANRAGGETPEQ